MGMRGLWVVAPTADTLFRYGEIRTRKDKIRQKFLTELEKPAETADGHKHASSQYRGCRRCRACLRVWGHGRRSFRSEGLYLRSNDFPSEDEQYEEYVSVVRGVTKGPVIIRTLDLGGDKILPKAMTGIDENNPFMGFRAIRFASSTRKFSRSSCVHF